MGIRILIGSGKEKIVKQMAVFLTENGFDVVGESVDGHDMLRKVHILYPDICIIDFQMKGMNGHEVSEVLAFDRISPVIVIISPSEVYHFTNLKNDAYFSFVIRPVNRDILTNTIELLVKSSKVIRKQELEIANLKKQIKSKEIIEKAKKLLMKRFELTEEEAHRRIQKQSMDNGISKYKVAETILESIES